jgi:PAS domain S-box-containing protein
MNYLPTLPQRTWLERLALLLAAVLLAAGVLTLAGWWLRMDGLLQPFTPQAPVKINTALAFSVLGGVLFALEFGQRRLAWLASGPALLGAVTLVENAVGIDLQIDEVFGKDHLLIGTEHPGRMAGMIAASLVLASLVLVWRATDWAVRARLFAEAVTGSVLASAGFSTLLGYAAGLPIVYRWGTATATAPLAALVLLCLGLALILLAWREGLKIDGEAPTWSFMPAVIACFTLTVVLSVGLRDREITFTRAKTLNAMDRLAIDIKDKLDRESSQFERIARRWGDGPPNAISAWEIDAKTQLAEVSEDLGCLSIHFVDLKFQTAWVYPRLNNEGAFGFNHAAAEDRRTAMQKAATSGAPTLSATTQVHAPGQGLEKGLVIYSPVIRAGRLAGYLAAEYAYRRFFETTTTAWVRVNDEYDVSIAIGGELVYTSIAVDAAARHSRTLEKTYTIADRRIRLSLSPSEAELARSRQYLPELALVAGLGITVLLGFIVRLARSARSGQHAAEHSNKKLFAENEERRRIEARLKVSDERLRLALDSTQIGIFEWNVSAGHVYYSTGLWAMLGYEHGRMPSTVEAWQSLIHLDDLPLYRRRTESQLNGVASFIEPEYRVRARSGAWRWVYTRSKSVTTHPDGRPIRIIGTVQDITARREAELALRESQAEARKLSLVAAKTDNPVLIGSADGRIEWVNEAFCRVMEYSVEEVVGKNPAHFMVGPDTSPRTVVRIRAAMARGLGISTDVVNYSKSGRKYHLHLEVQPVRGTSGEIENFIAVETDITARVETEQQLRRAKAEADDASRAKSEFLASMSHEIRTPMNGVIGMTSLLMESTLNPEQRDYVNTIRSSGEALLTIINDILDFSKIESGKMELERAPFELALCLEEALDLFALQAAAKKLEVGYHMASDVPAWIMGDVTRLRQVLVNLVNNAVKFTPSGSVSIIVRRAVREPTPIGFEPGVVSDPSQVILEFSVTDTGIGIPADRVDRLFKAFSQVDSSTTRKYGGTGLGLAICQRLCELMGGRIHVESRAGHGSSFIFTLQTATAPGGTESGLATSPAALRDGTVICVEDHPVTQDRLRTIFEKWGTGCIIASDAAAAVEAAAGLAQPPTLLVVDVNETDGAATLAALAPIKCPRLVLVPFGQNNPVLSGDGLPVASASKPIRTAAFLHAVQGLFQSVAKGAPLEAIPANRPIGEEIPLEVLLAEDNAVNQKVALRFLERLGYRADAVANGLEAITTLERRHYDLVLMDLQMPEMDGLEATRQIRARLPAARQPKIIALTANAMQGDRELCMAAGMDDHISKPVKMQEIAAAIRRHFGPRTEAPAPPQWIG